MRRGCAAVRLRGCAAVRLCGVCARVCGARARAFACACACDSEHARRPARGGDEGIALEPFGEAGDGHQPEKTQRERKEDSERTQRERRESTDRAQRDHTLKERRDVAEKHAENLPRREAHVDRAKQFQQVCSTKLRKYHSHSPSRPNYIVFCCRSKSARGRSTRPVKHTPCRLTLILHCSVSVSLPTSLPCSTLSCSVFLSLVLCTRSRACLRG